MKNNLNLFGIFFLIKGILNLLFTLFFVFYFLIGLFVINKGVHNGGDFFPFNIGSIFMVIGCVGAFFALVFGILTLMASKYLKEASHYNFILVMAVLNCLTGVLGILLGVFTIIELNKPEVRALFNKEN